MELWSCFLSAFGSNSFDKKQCRFPDDGSGFFIYLVAAGRRKQFTLKLDKNRQRPVVLLSNGLTALLDTGAYIPVWTDCGIKTRLATETERIIYYDMDSYFG